MNLHKSEFFSNFARKLQERLEGQRHILTDKEKFEIEGIVARFENAVSTYEVMQWLENFEEEDREYAITVLQHMRYYSDTDIYTTVKKDISKINVTYKGCKKYFVPIGAIGKSGSLVAYYTKRTISRLSQKVKDYCEVISIEELAQALDRKDIEITENDVLCLMDDFIGSGGTLKTFLEDNETVFPQFSKRCVMTIAYMERGEEIMQKYRLKVFGDEHQRAFTKRRSVFGWEKKTEKIREFAFKYGHRLHPSMRRHDINALGYANSQALVAFGHTTPNNTLPIIWSTAYDPEAKRSWHPLFPRFSNNIIERPDAMRRDYWLWIEKSKELESPVFKRSPTDYTIERARILALIDLIYTKRHICMWGQMLGITDAEVKKIINKARRYQLIDKEMLLTDEAERLLLEVRKSRKMHDEDEKEIAISENAYYYVPRKFKGGS